jgi:hypothetical protein
MSILTFYNLLIDILLLQIVKMLVIVVAVFGLCWLPIHVSLVLTEQIYCQNDELPDLEVVVNMTTYLSMRWTHWNALY